MDRRKFLLLSASTVVLGCETDTPVQAVSSSKLNFTSVSVDIGNRGLIDKNLAKWGLGVDSAKLASDVQQALSRQLASSSSSDARPVAARVTLNGIDLSSATPAVVRSGLIFPSVVLPYSGISGKLIISDAKTGEVLLSRGVFGDDVPGKVTLKSSTNSSFANAKPPQQAYSDVVNGFAEDVAREIFEAEEI